MSFRLAIGLALLATPAFAQGQADPTDSKAGDPSGAIRALSNASEDKPGKQTTQIPRMNPQGSSEPRGTPAGTSGLPK